MVILHIIAICATGALVLYADEQAILWLVGKHHYMHEPTVRFLHYAVSLGLGVIILTGGILFLPVANYFLSRPTFIVKMTAVTALIINSYFIDKLSATATTVAFSELSHPERVSFFTSGAISTLGWLTAITCGLLLG